MIPSYPAPSYLEYFQIKPQLFDSQRPRADRRAGRAGAVVPADATTARRSPTACATTISTVLGARHDWRNFDQQYARFVLNDDTQVKCYALESRAARGENVADAARALLVDPKWYGDGCVDLINSLAINQQFNSATTSGSRFASPTNRTTRTRARSSSTRSATSRPDPVLFDQATTTPPLLLARGVGPNTPSHQLALLAITRMARNDPAMAAATFSLGCAER